MDNSDDRYIIVNNLSSCAKKIDAEKIQKHLGGEIIYFDGDKSVLPDKAARITACGGDGTLNHLLNDFSADEKFYVPCGTFNETAKCAVKKSNGVLTYAGHAGNKIFAYVLAAGAFTPLGYAVDEKKKKRYKILAYAARILAEYKVYNISAEVTADDKSYNGDFSLILISNSNRCFGFPFNRLYDPCDNKLQLLLIKSPRSKGLFGRVQMFFPFFRSFFAGFSKEYNKGNIVFVNASKITISLASETPFCADGDKWIFKDKITAESIKLTPPVTVVLPKKLR